MSLWLSLLLLLVLLLLLLLLTQKKKHGNKTFNLPPTPPKLPIIGNLHQLGELPHRSLWNLSKLYGPIMLLQFGSKPTLIISSAEMAREVLKTYDINFCSRTPSSGSRHLSYNFLEVGFSPYSDYWREMRKICVLELFSMNRVQAFGHVRAEQVALMINSISQSSSRPINLTEKLFSLIAHITCRVAFGKSCDGREFDGNKFHEIVVEAIGMLGCFFAADFIPYIGWIIDVFTGLRGRLEKCFQQLDTFYQQVIDEHLDLERTKAEQEDIIDVLLGIMRDQRSAIHITKDHIKAILMNIFLGGVDSSALTMVWAMAELSRNPKAMKKVQEEIRTCVRNKGIVEEKDLHQLQYLKMVVKETLRLHPPGALLIPRECMRHCKINGYDVYPKTSILVNTWAIGRNPQYWENPDEFIPERFIDSSIDFKGQHFEFLPFGAGRRGCPAITMANSMMELALANLLYCFDWKLPSGMKKEDINMDEHLTGITVHKKSALHLVPINYNWQSS